MELIRRVSGIAWSAFVPRLPSLIGLACLGLVVTGVWGLFGREWGLIAAGIPGAAFYLYGQARIARGPREG